MRHGTIDLGVSRYFELGGVRQLGHGSRPGWPSVEEQMAAIPAGRWVVVEDDRATGGTLRFVLDRLPENVEIDRVELSLPAGSIDGDGGHAEIADCRDFLLGTHCGGLVVELPSGDLGRAPYLLPYVDPSARCASLAPSDAAMFSRDVWRLNAAAFDGTGLRVRDLDDAQSALIQAAGHHPSTHLVDVARWHAQVLERQALPLPVG